MERRADELNSRSDERTLEYLVQKRLLEYFNCGVTTR